MRRFRGSFTTFFIGTLVAAIVLPTVMYQLLVYSVSAQRLKESLDQRLSDYYRDFTKTYEREHQKSKSTIAFAQQIFARSPDDPKEKVASYFFGFGRRFFRVGLLDSLGRPFWTLIPNPDQTYLLPQPWEERTHWAGVNIPAAGLGGDTLSSLGMVVAPDGYAERVLLPLPEKQFLVADIRLSDVFAEAGKKGLFPGKTLFFVYGEDGTVLCHTPGVLDDETKARLKSFPPTSDLRIDNDRYRIGTYQMEGFRLILGIEYSDMQSAIQAGLGRGLVFTFFLTLGGCLLLMLAGLLVKRAVDVVVKRTGEIASGDFEKEIAIPYPEEFNHLAANINELSQRLKALTSERVQSAKLAAIGRFAAQLVHDLRSPVYGISLLTNELKKIISPGDPLYRYFQEIALGIERIGGVVDIIAEHGRTYEPSLEEVALDNLIQNVIKEFTQIVSCRFSTNLADLPRLRLDPQLWRRVFLNLFQNSYAAKKEGCEITVTTWRQENEVRIEVSDCSGGLAPEIADRLFEPFVSTKKMGLGLGLTYVKEIVEAHGGRLSVANTPGKGVKFTLVIPGQRGA